MGGVLVIAEAGVNHDGLLARAVELVDAAAEAGADYVKFQTFTAADLVLPTAPKADYQTRTTPVDESQFEMLRRLELSRHDHFVVAQHARQRGIGFLSTPFDRPSLAFLLDEMGLDLVKLPSSDLTNLPLLLDAGQSSASLILSTGMATMAEVERALAVVAFGSMNPGPPRQQPDWDEALTLPEAHEALSRRVTLLHCTSDYPAEINDANLRAMATMASAFGLPVGYSDHTQGIAASLAAVALGATVIEKHLTLDRGLPGPDHAASAEPEEFATLVRGIREVESALGEAAKRPTRQEYGNRRSMRKGLYAARAIAAGATITEDDLAVRRPMSAQGPEDYFSWLGARAPRSFAAGEAVDWSDGN